jgi:hypothetical protein
MADPAVIRLAEWLETWRMKNGAYNGFVIHRFSKKRMFRIHDTAWSQAAIIRGYANLFERERNPVWQRRMQLAADLQCSRLDFSTGKYKYAGHEDDRFCSLVHCALANCALLRALDFVDFNRKQSYLNTVENNVNTYCERLWVEDEGAYKFSEVDYYSPNEDRFVINFNMIAVENLILLWEKTGSSKYKERANRIGEWLLAHYERTRIFYGEFLKDKITVEQNPLSEWMSYGGLPYQFTPTQKDPDNCVLIYAGLATRGISTLYRTTQDPRYAKILQETVDFLLAMRDQESRFFFHSTNQGKIERKPQFIAGIGMMLVGLHVAKVLLNANWNWEDTLTAVLKQQYQNGSFPSFTGKNRSTRGKLRKSPIWEDAAASVNWNAQLFEYLTMLDDNDIPFAEKVRVPFYPFVYADSKHTVTIISLFPKEFVGVLFCLKKWPYSLVAVFPYDHYILSTYRKIVVAIVKKLIKGVNDVLTRF